MIRITTLLWIALLVVAGGIVMHVSYRVRLVQKHLEEVARENRQEQEAIRILGAEWDTLNDPHRIDALAGRHLSLEPTPVRRVVTLDQIPLKPSADQLPQMAAAGSNKAARARPAAKKSDQAGGRARPTVDVASRAAPGAAMSPSAPLPSVAPPSVAPPSVAPPSVTPSTLDGVGLILARAERRE